MSIIDALLAVVAPHECLGCRAEGSLLCGDCARSLSAVPERCYRCRKISPDALTCPACRKISRLKQVRVASVYDGVAKDLVWKLKFAGAQAAARQMTLRMLTLLDAESSAILMPVPTATSRVRQRGYDQATLLVADLARISGKRYAAGLSRTSQTHQVGAGRQQRLKQLANAFRVTKPQLALGAHIILVDDVVTTGATLEAAAATLKAAGAQRVDALVFAQP